MNDLDIIRSAARESNLDVYGLGLDREKWEATLVRYTRIIIQDCANTADGYVRDGEIDIARIIRRRFGVDE